MKASFLFKFFFRDNIAFQDFSVGRIGNEYKILGLLSWL